MSSNYSENELTIYINTRYSSINIHRCTLKALGDPDFINWGYNSRTKTLMLLGTGTDVQNALRVSLTKDGSCIIYSKSFVCGLRTVSGYMKEQGSFVLKGNLDKNISAISFPLAKAKNIMEY